MRKYRELLESLEKGDEVKKKDESLEEDRYEEELPSDEDMGMDSGLDMDDYEPDLDSDSDFNLDSELDMEIARDGLEDDYMGDDDEYVAPSLDDEPDMGGELGSEEDDVIFNYTATIQLTGYDFPLVLQADDMEEIKTVMRVMKQSGLNPQGDYKWNSKTFQIDLDESTEDKESLEEKADDDWAYDEGCEAAEADCKAGLGNYIGDPRESSKEDDSMNHDEKRDFMKGYKKTLDDKGYKLCGSGEKCYIDKK